MKKRLSKDKNPFNNTHGVYDSIALVHSAQVKKAEEANKKWQETEAEIKRKQNEGII